MSPAPTPRPRQVTLAAWTIMVGSVLVVLAVFQQLAGLQTLKTREAVEAFLTQPPGDGLGIGVQGVLQLLRFLGYVAAGCAAAAGILGYWVLQRSRGARTGLAVLAGPLFVTGIASGGFTSSLVAAAAAYLWLQPARDWFAGVEPGRRVPPTPSAPPLAAPRISPGPDVTARPMEPAGAPAPAPGPAPWGSTSGPRPGAHASGERAGRPGAVVWAGLLTWIFSGLISVVVVASAGLLLVAPDLAFDELRRQSPELAQRGISESSIRNGTVALAVVVLIWSCAASTFAVLVWRRVPWALTALTLSTGTAAVLLVGAVLGSVVLLVPLAGCVVTFVLLRREETRRWMAGGPARD